MHHIISPISTDNIAQLRFPRLLMLCWYLISYCCTCHCQVVVGVAGSPWWWLPLYCLTECCPWCWCGCPTCWDLAQHSLLLPLGTSLQHPWTPLSPSSSSLACSWLLLAPCNISFEMKFWFASLTSSNLISLIFSIHSSLILGSSFPTPPALKGGWDEVPNPPSPILYILKWKIVRLVRYLKKETLKFKSFLWLSIKVRATVNSCAV